MVRAADGPRYRLSRRAARRGRPALRDGRNVAGSDAGNARAHRQRTRQGDEPRRGLGSFPEALASKVDVRLESPVQSIEVRDDGAVVQLAGEQMRADHVILAATAPVAARLYRGGDEVERRLLATEYATGIKIGIATGRNWRNEPGLKDVWGFLIPRPDRQLIASATLESAKDITRVPDGEMLNLFVKPEAAGAMMDLSDEEIVAKVLRYSSASASSASDFLRLGADDTTVNADAFADHYIEALAVLVRPYSADFGPHAFLALLLRRADDIGAMGWFAAHDVFPFLLSGAGLRQ